MLSHTAEEIMGMHPFGAAHRLNIDTPPLKGLRLEPFRFHLETCRAAKTYPESEF
jgi:hypothetical protein